MNSDKLKPISEDESWKEVTVLNNLTAIPVCSTHGKNWMDHNGYVDNKDGTVSCKFCPWGFRLAGYLRIKDERVLDLRTLNRG